MTVLTGSERQAPKWANDEVVQLLARAFARARCLRLTPREVNDNSPALSVDRGGCGDLDRRGGGGIGGRP